MTEPEIVRQLGQRAWTGQPPGLDRIRTLLRRLGDPQEELRFVHIAGSNGKGSTAAMLASALTQAGGPVGLYTSPHLWRLSERFQVDGAPISPEELGQIAREVLDAAENQTEFELMTAIGMLFFARRKCRLVVLETGLGGRLDSTNVIGPPEAAVITRIGLEHTQLLGDTLEKIAAEKAGIIKGSCPVILCRQEPEVIAAVQARCGPGQLRLTAPEALHRLSCGPQGHCFTYRDRGPFRLPLLGGHQLENAAAALDALWTLGVSDEAAGRGLLQVRWPARLELVGRRPDLLLDGAHNPQCMEALARALKELYPDQKPVFLIGVLADKDYPSMLRPLLPLARRFVCVTPDSPRALPGEELARFLRELGQDAQAHPSPRRAALELAGQTGPEDVVCMCGSLYMIGEIRECLVQRNLSSPTPK